MMLQHCPTEVTGCVGLVFMPEGMAQLSQKPLQALVVIENSTQSGILILRVWPESCCTLDILDTWRTGWTYRLCDIRASSTRPSRWRSTPETHSRTTGRSWAARMPASCKKRKVEWNGSYVDARLFTFRQPFSKCAISRRDHE